MKLNDIPKLMPVPFGVSGPRTELLQSSPAGDRKASYKDGFPPITMLLKSAGGLPPDGGNMNQILFELASGQRWANAGAGYKFNTTFSDAVGGYPKGAKLLSNDGTKVYVSTKDDNKTDFNTSPGPDWVTLGDYIGLGDYATKTEVNSKLAKDQNGADIPNKEIFIKNLGLPEKFQEVGYSYSKKESDDNFQPKGKYASSEIFNTPGNGYTYMNSPAKKYRAVIGDNGEFAVINGENPLNPSTLSFDKNGIMQNGVVPATRVTGLFSKYLAVAGGRVIGTTYTNSNDKPMFIIISFGNYNGSMSIYVNDEIVYETGNTSNGITRVSAFFMVPPRGTYRVGAGSIAFEKWTECV